MLVSAICAMIVGIGPEVITYEYIGKIGKSNATLTIDWPKGSAKKLVPKLTGDLLIAPQNFYTTVGSNKSKGRVEFKVLKDKKQFAVIRLMRDPKTPKIWIGDYYLPNKKPIPVRLKAMGEIEYGC